MKQDTLLSVSVTSSTGIQVLLIGLMMFSLGMIVGINLVAIPAMQSVAASMPPNVPIEAPEYLQLAGQINNVAVGTAVVSVTGLIWIDYTSE